MIKIAVTGGLSSGKSTVCRFLTELGAYSVSADEIVHSLLADNEEIRQKVVHLLGPSVLTKGKLDRQAIAGKVFSHSETLKSLESILHPTVFHEIESRYQAIKNNSNYNLFVAEVPLLYETKSEALFDSVIAVLTSKKELHKKRLLEDAVFMERLSHQMSPEDKATKADFVLFNNGSLEDLKNEVTKIAEKICNQFKCKKEIL